MAKHARTQPNPRYRSTADLGPVDREHFEVARSIPGTFTCARFLSQYHAMYPRRAEGSMIPSDYCFERENKGNPMHPRFLSSERRNEYRFVGLGGERQ